MPRRILLADDDPIQSLIASALLQGDGFDVLVARDGLEALSMFEAEGPDLVITDYHMPGMDGLELTRAIRTRAGQRMVPVVVLTARTDAEILHASLEAGAVEFLTKPFEAEELLARMRALSEMVNLHDQLREEKARADQELAVVKHVLERFQAIGHQGLPPEFTMETLHTRRINGDTCLFRQGLPGVYFGMICDATGHGLMAGVSTIPVVEAFLSMVTKDIPLQAIYREINAKLRRLLPADRFVCLILFRVHTHQGVLSVLNAGMPDAYLLRRGAPLRTFSSTGLPAGIRDVPADEIVLVEAEVSPGDHFLAMSDGFLDVVQVPNLLEELRAAPTGKDHPETLRERIHSQVADAELADDISWALWEIPQTTTIPPPQPPEPWHSEHCTESFRVSFRLHPGREDLQGLLPSIHTLLTSAGVDQGTLQTLGLLLSEAITNAVDHGILQLTSTLKEQEGFEGYELRRHDALAELKEGIITLNLVLRRDPSDSHAPRCIEAEILDSGPGFDWRGLLARNAAHASQSYGRGITIIQAMAMDVQFNEAGNGLTFKLPCGG